jgi:hypothetical protein
MIYRFEISDLHQSVKWLEWLFLNGQAWRIFGTLGAFEDRLLSARLDWVCMGAL